MKFRAVVNRLQAAADAFVAAGSVKSSQQNGVDTPSVEWAALEQQQTAYTKRVEAWVRKHRVPKSTLEVAQATLQCHRRIEKHLAMLVHLKRYEVSSHPFPRSFPDFLMLTIPSLTSTRSKMKTPRKMIRRMGMTVLSRRMVAMAMMMVVMVWKNNGKMVRAWLFRLCLD